MSDDLQGDLAGTRAASARLERTISDLTDEQARQPSRLPGWSVGHVLTHIARNGDSVVRRLEGAARGVIVDQYSGGAEGRAREIEEGAARSAVDLVADVRATNRAVEAACDAMPEHAWANLTRPVRGGEQPATAVVFSRWREVEVHHADLGLAYTPADWPAELAETWLPQLLASLPQRTDRVALLAWSLGRGPAPDLQSWG